MVSIPALFRQHFSHVIYKLYIVLANYQQRLIQFGRNGRLAQLVERTLSMREVGGSKPPLSTILFSRDLFCAFNV